MAMQALILGFGGSGAHVLTYLKELNVFKYGTLPPTLRFLLFDTIADWQPGKTVSILGGKAQETTAAARTHEQGTSLDQNTEYFHLRDGSPGLADMVNRELRREDGTERFPHLAGWLNATWLNQNISSDRLNITEGAAQQRQIGRFALFQNVEQVLSQLRRDMAALRQHGGGATLNVWIVGSSAGGTGAGCLIDAALLARMAAPRGTALRVAAVVVLPDTYAGLEGISKARAYSVFREIDRLQRRGFKPEDEVRDLNGNPYHFTQNYNASGVHRAILDNTLFDNIFVIGRPSPTEDQRQAFFSSAVAAMDPFLDDQCGPRMLEHEVNRDHDLVSFGASRLYIPMKTYEELFAWQEVEAWLSAATAANAARPGAVHFGSAGDREREAGEKVRRLLPFFEELQNLVGKSREEITAFARSLDPKTLVMRALQIAAGSAGGLDANSAYLNDIVPLTYIDPFLSLKESEEDRVPAHERLVRTYKENRKAKGVKEKQDASRDRFGLELDGAARRYRDPSGAAGSFEQGQHALYALMVKVLIHRVDEEVLRDLAAGPFAASAQHPSDGTALTRLHQELQWITTGDGGKLAEMQEVVRRFINDLANERNEAEKAATAALADLRDARPGMLGDFSEWVETYQIDARDRMATLVRFHQRHELLRLVQRLLAAVGDRFAAWLRLLDDVLKDLVRISENRTPLLHAARANIERLEGRLSALAKDTSALIGLEPNSARDTGMQGFREVLRARATDLDGKPLHAVALDGARWVSSVDEQGRPQISLVYRFEGEEAPVPRRDLPELHRTLHARFQTRITRRLEGVTIFEYLQYASLQRGTGTEKVVARLNEAADVLAETNRPAAARFVYRLPDDPNQRLLGESLQLALGRLPGLKAGDSETLHSDPYSITLLKTVKPNPDEIHDLHACADDYLDMLRRNPVGKADYDQPIRRAQVYHLLRGEQEAWFIERRVKQQSSDLFRLADLMPPRLVRLLEDPERMKAFVDGVATEIIAFDGENWCFRDQVTGKTLQLTDRTSSLMRAATVFVVQQIDARPGLIEPLSLANAERSAVTAAQGAGMSKAEMVRRFVEGPGLDALLVEYVRQTGHPESPEFQETERLRLGLRRIFRFYGHPETRTSLAARAEF